MLDQLTGLRPLCRLQDVALILLPSLTSFALIWSVTYAHFIRSLYIYYAHYGLRPSFRCFHAHSLVSLALMLQDLALILVWPTAKRSNYTAIWSCLWRPCWPNIAAANGLWPTSRWAAAVVRVDVGPNASESNGPEQMFIFWKMARMKCSFFSEMSSINVRFFRSNVTIFREIRSFFLLNGLNIDSQLVISHLKPVLAR